MTDKYRVHEIARFNYSDIGEYIDEYHTDRPLRNDILVELLNELSEENQQLKSILQDMGLIMSDEEVKNVRDEIASKLIKPVCKGNGFDVDVNTENGFTIIPKEVNNDKE